MTPVRLTHILVITGCLAACRQPEAPQATAPAEPPTLDVTSWTTSTELFMEYPPLVAGQAPRFAVHLTRLSDFSALNAGQPHIELLPEGGGTAVTLPGTPPLRPGAFRVEGPLPTAGRYRMALVVDAPGLADRHELGIVTVFGSDAAGAAAAEAEPDDDVAAIAYLKEQQWTNPFATEVVAEAELRTTIRVPGVVNPVTGGEAVVAAPAAGRFAADGLLSIGALVRADQVVGRIEPRLATGDDRATLAASVAESRIAVDGAKVELTRAERLLAEKAIPARRVEDAQRALAIADARLSAAEARLAQRDQTLATGGGLATSNAFVLRAPIAGRVAEVHATLGAAFDEGAPLFRIVRMDEVELQALVPVSDVATVRSIERVAFEWPGLAEPLLLRHHHQHDSGVIDDKTKTLPVQFEVDNPRGALLIGQTGTVVLTTNDRQRLPTVAAEAVLTEAGRTYVFVQTGGEQFTKRPIEAGARDGSRVGVRSGVKVGDRVVTRGAYQIQLASSAKGLPAEGHVH